MKRIFGTRRARCWLMGEGELVLVSVFVVGLLSTIVFAACAATPAGPMETGHVAGFVYATDIGKISPATTLVTITSADGKASAVYTADDGSFAFDLPPGAYEVTGVRTKVDVGDQATPVQVTVAVGETTSIKLGFIAP